MHPAYSVIVFTTASGAGYGLLIWLSAASILGIVPRAPPLGLAGIGLALVLITAGLLSSLLHLGRPERAWRAFSQWRSSWLSREGVAAVATYVPVAALGLSWMFGEAVPGQFAVAACLSIAMSLVTVWCTGMIYASLPTIRAWHHPLVAPIYVALSLATGGVLLCALLSAFGHDAGSVAAPTALMLAIGCALKVRYWSTLDRAKRVYTAEAAIGLRNLGPVRPLDPPHTQPNFVMREMGYRVARKHATQLRRLTIGLLFAAPLVLTLLLLIAPSAQLTLALISTASASIGVALERWLFFAEAEHVVVLYYQGGAA